MRDDDMARLAKPLREERTYSFFSALFSLKNKDDVRSLRSRRFGAGRRL
jgi:hypothetical protein